VKEQRGRKRVRETEKGKKRRTSVAFAAKDA